MPTRVEFTGQKASIELYESDDGGCLAHDYLASLSAKDRQKIDVLFEKMGLNGEIRNKEKFKKLENTDGLFEFKSFQMRLICFYAKGTPKRIIITHGVTKKQYKHSDSDINRALEIKRRFLGE